jgi:predicted RNA binding protein YcfA (HicA-like mRNA interferase family)
MPPKIKELIKKLESAGFIARGGKGSHRNFKHPKGVNITISGKPGNDAKPYQEADVKKALERIKDEKK